MMFNAAVRKKRYQNNQYGDGKKKKKSTSHIKHVKNTGLEVTRNPPTSRVPFNYVDALMKGQYGTQQGRIAYRCHPQTEDISSQGSTEYKFQNLTQTKKPSTI